MHLGTACDIARAIQIVFGEYPNIRIVQDIWPIQIFANTIRIPVFVANTAVTVGDRGLMQGI